MNERTVLETIRTGAPISRAEISRSVGISKPTVSLALRSLLEAGLVREASHDPDGPSYGALFFEPVPEAALVLGLDLGARFVRGAICDLTGSVRARQDVELPAETVDGAIDAIISLHDSLLPSAGLDADLVDGTVVGVPGVVAADSGKIYLTHITGLEGVDIGGELERRLGHAVTLENDINLAALGEQWHGVARGVDDFVFLSVGTGVGVGLVLRGELHRGQHGAAGELDVARAGMVDDADPCAEAVSALAARLTTRPDARTSLAPPYDTRAIFAAARGGDAVSTDVVREVARRIALHVVPIAAVADVGLIVLGGGIGTNGDLLLDPIRELLDSWLPYPPRIEVSSLGEAAVLTGALAVGLEAAQDNVFANRRP
jgi:predicted NBD/HSP70 family sugar kinase